MRQAATVPTLYNISVSLASVVAAASWSNPLEADSRSYKGKGKR